MTFKPCIDLIVIRTVCTFHVIMTSHYRKIMFKVFTIFAQTDQASPGTKTYNFQIVKQSK